MKDLDLLEDLELIGRYEETLDLFYHQRDNEPRVDPSVARARRAIEKELARREMEDEIIPDEPEFFTDDI